MCLVVDRVYVSVTTVGYDLCDLILSFWLADDHAVVSGEGAVGCCTGAACERPGEGADLAAVD